MTWPAAEAALITGAASGIDLGISRALVAAGAKVALAQRVHGEIDWAFADFDGRHGSDRTAPIMVEGSTPIAY